MTKQEKLFIGAVVFVTAFLCGGVAAAFILAARVGLQ